MFRGHKQILREPADTTITTGPGHSQTDEETFAGQQGGRQGDDDKVENSTREGVGQYTGELTPERLTEPDLKNLDDDTPETPSERDEECTFKRGFCLIHNTQGVKYTVVRTKWKDRGGGRGFGNVSSRLVRYCCSGVKTDPDYKSSNM